MEPGKPLVEVEGEISTDSFYKKVLKIPRKKQPGGLHGRLIGVMSERGFLRYKQAREDSEKQRRAFKEWGNRPECRPPVWKHLPRVIRGGKIEWWRDFSQAEIHPVLKNGISAITAVPGWEYTNVVPDYFAVELDISGIVALQRCLKFFEI